jgi:diguanylate cyclase (GGDEF)-like protein
LDLSKSWQKTLALAPKLASGLLVLLLFYIIDRHNYLLFRTVLEGLSTIVAALIFVLATRTYKYSGNSLLLFLGNAFLFIAMFDFFHIIAYRGMNVFPVQGANTATQLWIAGHYLLALTFLLAAIVTHRRWSSWLQVWPYAVVTGLVLLSIIWLRIFPDCYIDVRGPTAFKVVSDYLIILITLAAMLLFYRQRHQRDQVMYRVLMAAMSCAVLSELSYLFFDIYGVMNFVRYIFQLASYVLIYNGVVLRVLDAPFDTIFLDLKNSAMTDNLTGLYSRQGFRELIKNELFLAQKRGLPLGVLVMDIDNFKLINDRFGQLVGDQLLQDFANLFQSSLRGRDIACRLGGDEFAAIVRASREGLTLVEDRIRMAFQVWSATGEATRDLGLSIGSVVWEPGMKPDAEDLILMADRMMYRKKEQHLRP